MPLLELVLVSMVAFAGAITLACAFLVMWNDPDVPRPLWWALLAGVLAGVAYLIVRIARG